MEWPLGSLSMPQAAQSHPPTSHYLTVCSITEEGNKVYRGACQILVPRTKSPISAIVCELPHPMPITPRASLGSAGSFAALVSISGSFQLLSETSSELSENKT